MPRYYTQDTKTTLCSCGRGYLMLDEVHREFNPKTDDGKRACAECVLEETYKKFFRSRNG